MKGLDLKEIPSDCIKSTLKQVIEKRLGSNDVEICIESGSKKGDNFAGVIYRILYNRKGDKQQSSLILKIAAQDLLQREVSNLRTFFEREIRIYQESISIFHDFQLSKGINPKKDGFNEYAECYFVIEEEFSESLFLEDLRVNQFEMLDHRKENLTFDHVSIVMKALGKFHALSFALRDQEPDTFSLMTSNLEENYWSKQSKGFTNFLKLMATRTINTLNKGNRQELCERFVRAIEKGYGETAIECISAKSAEPYAVLCHGDAWVNNMMFKNDASGKPISVKLLDWQFSRYASPVTDIIFFMMSCTTKELRNQYYEDFIKIYYDSLATLLRKMGSDPNKIFPYEALMDQFKKFGKYGMLPGIILLSILLGEPSSVPNLDELSSNMSVDALVDLFKIPENAKADFDRRLLGLVEDSAHFGYI